MKAKWLKMKNTGKARFVYTVVGTAKEIAEYVENQGEYCRFLQSDGTISENETNTPVYYSTNIVGKNPELVWDDENLRYRANMGFEDAVLMDAVSKKYSNPVETTSETSSDKEDADDAEIEPQPKKKSVLKRGK
jgi:hypothetical protein